MQVRRLLAPTGLAMIMSLAACSRANPAMYVAEAPAGGGDGGANAAQPVSVAADPAQIAYQQKTLAGPAGQEFSVTFQNPAATQHNWVIVQPGQEDAVAAAASAANGNPAGIQGVIAGGAPIAGSSETISVPATPPGTYSYICTVPGHYQAGMRGQITLGAAAPAGASGAPAASGQPAASGAPGGAAGDAGGASVASDPAGALAYQQKTLQAQAGQAFAVNFNNPAPLPHNWVLVQPGQEDAVAAAATPNQGNVPPGTTGVIAAGAVQQTGGAEPIQVPALQPGTYSYICTVPGHYQAGMKGTLTVQ